MAAKLSSDIIVDVIEATIRVLVDTGLTRDEALQVMLSQIAVQVSPDVMTIATKLNDCLLYTSPSPRDKRQSRMPSSA